MTESSKIEFRHRRIDHMADITDMVEMLFPANRNQQHAAARILLALKSANSIVPNLKHLEQRFGISRRTLQRTRAKLSRLGLIKRISWMNSRYGGQEGWKLSGRMSGALKCLASKIDAWRQDTSKPRLAKDQALAALLK